MAEVIALHALEEITDYIALDNQAAAKKFVCKVFDKILWKEIQSWEMCLVNSKTRHIEDY